MKKCLLIISSLACFSHIDAGWRDQWVWFKSLFSGFSIKRPSLTRKQMVIGGVGALAVAGAAWWWLKSPKKPTNKTQNPGDTLGRSQKESLSKKSIDNSELLQQPQNPDPLIELTINQPEEIKDGPVSIDFSDSSFYSDHKNVFGIRQKTAKGFDVETIITIIKKQKIIKADDATVREVRLKNVDLNQLQNDDYVFVNNPLSSTQTVMIIGKYISRNQDKVTVLSGSLFYNVALEEREYKVSDVFVPVEKEEIQIVESDVNKERLIKEEEKRIKLAQVESELEAAKREKLLLESELAHEKTNSSIKQAKDFFNQTNKLTNFEQLFTQYENNKDKETLKQLTEQFKTLDPDFSNNESELWKTLKERYNNAIKGTNIVLESE